MILRTGWTGMASAVTLMSILALGCDGGGDDSAAGDSLGEQADAGDKSMADGQAGQDAPGPAAGEQAVTLHFEGRVGDELAACGVDYGGVGEPATTVRIQDFRFYVSEVELLDASGEAYPVALDADGIWQDGTVALVDFEDGSADCEETGNADLRTMVTGTVPEGEYAGLRFTLGVPAEANHQDSTLAGSPLNIPAMFWVWQSGYKFLRLDLANGNAAPADNWFIHIGSTGCDSASPSEAPDGPCLKSNRLRVQMDDFDIEGDMIVADVAALLAGVDVSTNTQDTPPGCMSGAPDVNECGTLYGNLGLSFDSGGCTTDCSDQLLFRAEPMP